MPGLTVNGDCRGCGRFDCRGGAGKLPPKSRLDALDLSSGIGACDFRPVGSRDLKSVYLEDYALESEIRRRERRIQELMKENEELRILSESMSQQSSPAGRCSNVSPLSAYSGIRFANW